MGNLLSQSPSENVVFAVTGLVVVLSVGWYFLLSRSRGRGENVSGALLLRPDVNSALPSDSNVLHPISWRKLRVHAITTISANVRLLRIALPRPSDTLDLPIGRHVSLLAELPSGRVLRPYTPVSPPWAAGFVDLLIKRYDGGLMSNHVFSLRPGDSVSMRGPVGNLR